MGDQDVDGDQDLFAAQLPDVLSATEDNIRLEWYRKFVRLSMEGLKYSESVYELKALRIEILRCLETYPPRDFTRDKPLSMNFLVEMARKNLLLCGTKLSSGGCIYGIRIVSRVDKDWRVPSFEEDETCIRWYYEGKLHNLYDFPAVIWKDGMKEWYQFGVPNRRGQRPNCETPTSVSWQKEHGSLFRRDFPLVKIAFDGAMTFHLRDEIGTWTFMTPSYGTANAPAEDSTMKKTPREIIWSNRHGVNRNCDLPAVLTYDGRLRWFMNGVKSRADGNPARIRYKGSRADDFRIQETWYKNGQRGRDRDQPAWTLCKIVKGEQIVIASKWYRDGKLHRIGNAAVFNEQGFWYYDNGVQVDSPPMMKVNIDQSLLALPPAIKVELDNKKELDDRMELDDAGDCLICGDQKDTVFTAVPCGHILTVCEDCVKELKLECPICRRPLQMYLKSFKT